MEIHGTTGADAISGVNGFSNSLFGAEGDDLVTGGDADDQLYGEEGNDRLEGLDGSDYLQDDLGNNVVEAGAGDDTIDAAQAFVVGGSGNDTVFNSGPNSIIAFNSGDGNDTVYVGAGLLTLSLGAGISPEDLQLSTDGSSLLLSIGDMDSIQLVGGAGADETSWPTITLQMFGSVHEYDFNAMIADFRAALDADPSLTQFALDGVVQAHQTSMSETQALGGMLAWEYAHAGSLAGLSDAQIQATLANPEFGVAPQDIPVNHAPTLDEPLADQSATANSAFSFVVPNSAFSDADAGDTLAYSASLEDGSALPGWLSFDAETRTLSGTPAETDVGAINVKVTATDGQGEFVSDVFALEVDSAVITGTAGNDVLTGTAGIDTLLGLGGNDTLNGGAGNDTLDGGTGVDTMAGGAGDDTYVVDNVSDAVNENAGEGVDTILSSVNYFLALRPNVENITLTGTSSTQASGNDLANVLIGNSGNNSLNGGAGADTLIGGLGDDFYTVDDAGDVIVENAGEGSDWVFSSVSYTLGDTLENLVLQGGAAIDGTGNAGNNAITGNGAANVLTGGAGNDNIDGGAGIDTLIGGIGDDTYHIDDAADVVTENAGEGTDMVVSAAADYTLAANVENLFLQGGIANLNATGNEQNNWIVGNAGSNVLSGGAGSDQIDGGVGADTLIGGTGSDSYVVDNAGDVVVENAGEGTDSVSASVSYTLSANVETLRLSGSSAINGTGNELDNHLFGNGAANILDGGAGNDTLDGNAGADTMIGGAGNDTYTLRDATDVVVEAADEGTDVVNSVIDYTLTDNVENLNLIGSGTHGTGNALDNVLTGSFAADVLTGLAGNDTLDGQSGADTLVGGTGNDTYMVDNVGDIVTESADEGTDTVVSRVNYTLGDNVENLTLALNLSTNATGNSLDNVLTGNAGSNVLTGGAGNDVLEGQGSNDTLIGGTGDDTYVFARGHGVDTLQENDSTSGNTDTVQYQSGIAADQLWFQQSGNDLVVSIIGSGTGDHLTIQNWYSGSQYHVEQFKTADGSTLLDSQVQNLVDAMAAFSPPAQGQTTLPQNYADTLEPVIAANWQ